MSRLEDRDGPEYATADEERDAAIASDVDAHERMQTAQLKATMKAGRIGSDWNVMSRIEKPSGTYFALNMVGKAGSVVTVKARAKPGPAYICLTCLVNSCPHTRFVASIDTADVQDTPMMQEGAA
jgi:hypothetical protein